MQEQLDVLDYDGRSGLRPKGGKDEEIELTAVSEEV